jgi:repressor LexA
MPVTTRQKKVLDFIARYIEANDQAPTIAEIGKQFNMSSPASVHRIVSDLEREGMIRRIPNVSRGIEVVKEAPLRNEDEIPLLGIVAAGQPIEAILGYEAVRVPGDMIGRERTFALRVRGDSMIDEQIRDGDFIVVESRQTAENGQTVVALIDGSDATVKRFHQGRNYVRLEAANPNYEPIIVKPADRVRIQGIVIGVIRKYDH